MRRQIVAGNWKMNKDLDSAKSLLLSINTFVSLHKPKCEIIVAPPYPYLDLATDIFSSHAEIASQNISEYDSGAYTGEVSAEILKSIDVHFAIIGHSERRSIFGETNEQISKKIDNALKNEIHPIICCGESLKERKENQHKDIVKKQILTALQNVSNEQMDTVILAYEPVWAIGTGETASPEQAQNMHEFIRTEIADKYGEDTADKVRILYGGSVKPGNAKSLFTQPDIDGGLIGGASLNVDDFTSIMRASCRCSSE